MGTVCILDRKERNDIDIKKLEAFSDRVAELLQEKSAAKRSESSPHPHPHLILFQSSPHHSDPHLHLSQVRARIRFHHGGGEG